MTKFLSCTNMTGGYGGEDIIHGCDIEVDRNQIVVIVGPNGAGKSTAMKAMPVSYTHLTLPTKRIV